MRPSAQPESHSLWRTVAAAGIFPLTAAAFVARGLLMRSPIGQYPSDGTRAFYFAREHLLRSLAGGHLPLWDPFVQFGTPFLPEMQWATLYPVNLLLIRLP